eukprot:5605874-Prymnesium_polylepis.5
MSDTEVGKETTSDKEKVRPAREDEHEEDVLIVDTSDGADITLSGRAPKRRSKYLAPEDSDSPGRYRNV